MGSVSLYLRAPFVALGVALHAGPEGIYRWGALPCLLAVAWCAVWLGRIARRRGAGRLAQAAISALCLLGPLVHSALFWGHPEELLAGSLGVGALLAAVEQRALLTALLAGLAVATKQSALVLVLPAVLVLERGRAQALLGTAGVAVAAMLPMAVANFDAFRRVFTYISTPQPLISLFSWLYPVSPSGRVLYVNMFGDPRVIDGHRMVALEAHTRPLIVVLGLAIPLWLWWRQGRQLDARQALIATALAVMLRCALDPDGQAYYNLPIPLLLVGLDALAGRRLPTLGLLGTAVAFVVLDRFPAYLPMGLANAIYIATTVSVGTLLVGRLRTRAQGKTVPPRPRSGSIAAASLP
jgi:hypothetical protein